MKPYPRYKDSGFKWIGDIPDEWTIKRIKHASTKIGSGVTPKGGAEVYQKSGIPLLRSQNIHFDGLKLDDVAYISEEVFETMLNSEVYSGDVLLNITGGSIGRCFYADEKIGRANVNQHVCIIRPNNTMETNFLFYILSSHVGQTQVFNKQLGANREGLNFEQLKNFIIPHCPLTEQRQIVSYLDHIIDQIDTLIKKKKKLIHLLKEELTTVINEAVTNGLDPNVKMKDSGIEWLGEIPEHWIAVRAKAVFYEVKDRSDTGGEELLTVSHLTGVTKRSDKNVNMFMADSLEGYKVCKEGDLIINTMWAWMGALGTTQFDGIVSPSYNVYRFRNLNQIPEYYDVLFRTPNFISEINRFSKGVWSSRLRLYPTEFFEIQLPLIPVEEQKNIVDHIKKETSRINSIISKSEKEIELLQEYRTALISEVVTGKIDVRDWREPEK